ncbi:Extradiol aromatic ring-opening dioxygenase [Russula earlei]|uniref:Extradiol aromatic ring-opening dioxygenase n=1 Tax=Russula earlei TaxID=71964 RepID=A0ACC0TYI8_9AGAM|nr:Extradiol aromatic ring-opening dioxygenase [Russula earlei]
MSSDLPLTPAAWKDRLAALPGDPGHIPAFFFGHGSPLLALSHNHLSLPRQVVEHAGPESLFAAFLRDFGPALLAKYKPKGILVLSAHWETEGAQLVTDYGDENPLLMDYHGFPPELYELEFVSRGDATLSRRAVDLFHKAGIRARLTGPDEARGRDGRGFEGPGLDHGVFVPFRLMFGQEFRDVPIVQASIDGSLSPEANWACGKALTELRDEGILILSGGLTVHNLRDRKNFAPQTADPLVREFNEAVSSAISVSDPIARKTALFALTQHNGFRLAHPREEHFVPIYVAAGAGEQDAVAFGK